MKLYIPTPTKNIRADFTPEDINNLARELNALGFGRAHRTPEKCKAWPALDLLAYLVEEFAQRDAQLDGSNAVVIHTGQNPKLSE